jgi:hypothetical protein
LLKQRLNFGTRQGSIVDAYLIDQTLEVFTELACSYLQSAAGG